MSLDRSKDSGLGIRKAVARSAALALFTLLVVGVGSAAWAWHVAREQALADVVSLADASARGVVSAFATAALLAGEQPALSAMDTVIQPQVRDGSVLLARIRRRDGTVLYSDRRPLMGGGQPLEPDAETAFRGVARAIVTDVSPAESALLPGQRAAVEVYVPFTARTGERLLYEVYMPLSRLPQARRENVRDILPVALTGLVLLQLLQVPLWVSLARTIRTADLVRTRSLERAATAAESERRRLARFLHDDVIQNLAGAAYALDVMPNALPDQTSATVRTALATAGRAVSGNLGVLRTLIADLYPGRLDQLGLPAALDGMLAPLRDRGIDASLVVSLPDEPPALIATVMYSAAREAIRNADEHAAPRSVRVRVLGEGNRFRLAVADDGSGFDPVAVARPSGERSGESRDDVPGAAETAAGHYGLMLMRDVVEDAGGTVTVTSRPGAGTVVEVRFTVSDRELVRRRNGRSDVGRG